MKYLFFFILFWGIWVANAQNIDLKTFYEKSGYLETPRYEQTIEYCSLLAKSSDLINFTNIGVSPQGRKIPLLIIDKNKNFAPEKVQASGNAIILIQACIHPGEPDGKDAGFMLIRDILNDKKLGTLLDHITILFIPILNVDGHERFGPYNRINQNGPKEMGWRTTAQNYNLNRDFIKADAPEIQAWLTLYNTWLPDFFIDTHVTDGADYQYPLTYMVETCGNMDKNLTGWTENVYMKPLIEKMNNAGYPICQYVQFREWHDPRSGMELTPAPPMLSQGYAAVQNRPGLLIETHMFKDYKTRVSATYKMILFSLEIIQKNYKQLKDLNADADKLVASSEFRKQPFPLSYKLLKDSTVMEFKGFEYTVEHSDLSGGLWFKYNNQKPTIWKIPVFGKSEPDETVILPEAYILTPEWLDVIARLKMHGIKYTTLNNDVRIKVKSEKYTDLKWGKRPYEGRFKLENKKVTVIEEERNYPAGSVIVDLNQRSARVIALLFESGSDDSFLAWGFFNTLFQQKEYGETYVLEKLARDMMAADPKLKEEFEIKKANEPEFANDTYGILNWFYSKSPYWDIRYNVSPVGKIYDRSLVDKLKTK